MTRAVTAWDGVRATRLAVFAVTATCLALGSHLVAGGAPPALVPTLLTCVLPWAAGAFLTRRRRGWSDILVMLGAVQLALHTVFAAAGTAPGGTLGMHSESVGSSGAMAADCPMGVMASMGSSGRPSAGQSASGVAMLVAHVAATVVTAALLARGEQALHALIPLIDHLRRGIRLVVHQVAPLPVLFRQRLEFADPTVPRLGLVAVAGIARRGPPTPVW